MLASSALSAATSLDSSNWHGTEGNRFWRITTPGNYYLGIPDATFVTDHEFAISIETGDVALDGNGKELTGSAFPFPVSRGVQVRGPGSIANVAITNLAVSNKAHGISLEGVSDAQVTAIYAANNYYGFYFAASPRIRLQYNRAFHNYVAFICFESAVDSPGFVIANNVVDPGDDYGGVELLKGCTDGTVADNHISDGGIRLAKGADRNAIRSNVVRGRSTRIEIESSFNSIVANVSLDTNNGLGVYGNSNVIEHNTLRSSYGYGIFLFRASGNIIRGNTVADHFQAGIGLRESGGQLIYDNYFANATNVELADAVANTWNSPRSAGANVAGGPYIGGNYWVGVDGTGFSPSAPDVDRDGISDVPYALGMGSVDALPLRAKPRMDPNDSFDGDRVADLLWRKESTGENAIWLMQGSAATGHYIPRVADQGWRIAGRESFDGDGQADILWRHADGRNAIWFMDGTGVKASSGFLPAVTDSRWKVAGVCDFDGDGVADILWHNDATGEPVIWFMRGLDIKRVLRVPAVSLDWRISAVLPVRGYGRIWWQDDTGRNVVWHVDAGSFTSLEEYLAGLAWRIVGVGRFRGFDSAGLLWRNPTTGQNGVWFSGGSTDTKLLPSASAEWSVAGVGDYDGDGVSDILWRNADGTLVHLVPGHLRKFS